MVEIYILEKEVETSCCINKVYDISINGELKHENKSKSVEKELLQELDDQGVAYKVVRDRY